MIIWKKDDKSVKVDRRVMYYTKYMLQIFQKTKEEKINEVKKTWERL